MSDQTVVNFVHRSIAEEVASAFAFDASFASRVELYDGEPTNLFESLSNTPDSYAIVFVPSTWASLTPEMPEALNARVNAGTLRFVLWTASEVPKWSVPFTVIPASLEGTFRQFLLAHLTRVPTWGLQTMLPPKSRVLTERVRTENQVAQKIDESIQFVSTLTPAFNDRTMALRLALTVMFDAALGDPAVRAAKKPATYQIAVSDDALVCSVRWINPELTLEQWRAPAREWRMLFGLARASLVIVSPQSGELEVMLAFDASRTPAPLDETPLVVDVLSSARQTLAAGLTELTDLDFEYFTQQLRPEDAATFVSASTATNPGLELAGLRVEYHKLGLQLKQTQDVSSDHLRRMAQAIEAEKIAGEEIHKLTVQLEYAKEKEAELTRKLQSAMDQYLTLKLAKNGKKKAG